MSTGRKVLFCLFAILFVGALTYGGLYIHSQREREKVYQDMELYRWALVKDEQSVHQIAAERRVWIQVVKGNVTINGVKASTSDGLAIWDEQAISIHADSDSEILLFDLPPV